MRATDGVIDAGGAGGTAATGTAAALDGLAGCGGAAGGVVSQGGFAGCGGAAAGSSMVLSRTIWPWPIRAAAASSAGDIVGRGLSAPGLGAVVVVGGGCGCAGTVGWGILSGAAGC